MKIKDLKEKMHQFLMLNANHLTGFEVKSIVSIKKREFDDGDGFIGDFNVVSNCFTDEGNVQKHCVVVREEFIKFVRGFNKVKWL